MEVAREFRQSPERIVHDRVIVVAHREPTDQLDAEALSRFAKAIEERLIGLLIRPAAGTGVASSDA